MRSTNQILCDVKEGTDVDKEELRMALLVLDSICFFNHTKFRNLLKGGLAADLVVKQSFPEANANLGVPVDEWNALRADPIEYLGPDHIPGTAEYERIHSIAKKMFDKIVQSEKE